LIEYESYVEKLNENLKSEIKISILFSGGDIFSSPTKHKHFKIQKST